MRIWNAVAAAAVGIAATAAQAQDDFPSRAITIIVPYSPGGATDTVGRIVASALETQFDVPVVVENQPGANGLIGLESLSQAQPDGYTLGISTQPNQAVLPAIDDSYPTEMVNELVPIGMTTGYDFYLVVNSNSEITTPAELIDYVKAHPGEVSFGSSGLGTNQHFIGEMLNAQEGLEMVHIPFQRSIDALLAVATGDMTYNAPAWPIMISQMDNPDFRVIASFSDERTDALPDVPTMKESGYPEFVAESWQGLYGPPGMPDEIRDILSEALVEGMSQDEVRDRLAPLGVIAKPSDAETLAQVQEEEAAVWQQRADDLGISLGN